MRVLGTVRLDLDFLVQFAQLEVDLLVQSVLPLLDLREGLDGHGQGVLNGVRLECTVHDCEDEAVRLENGFVAFEETGGCDVVVLSLVVEFGVCTGREDVVYLDHVPIPDSLDTVAFNP